MSEQVASMINLFAGFVVIAGLVIQRRAISRYGKVEAVRSKAWRFHWNRADMFNDPAGLRLYMKGDAFFSWGMMVSFAMMGYLVGIHR